MSELCQMPLETGVEHRGVALVRASPDEPACAYSWGSMTVAVTRTSKRNWLVTTDAPVGYESFVGDQTVLADSTGATPVALYHMPFQLTVDCPKCP